MDEFGDAHDDVDLPDLADREDVIRFLEHPHVPLPDGLTMEKIKSRGSWWSIDEGSFSFRVERHPSGPFSSRGGTATPARWHVRTRYTYDLASGDWSVEERMREFHVDPGMLVDAEFEQEPFKHQWEQALDRARAAEVPEAVLEERLAVKADMYRTGFEDPPEDQLEEMLDALEAEFRRRADME